MCRACTPPRRCSDQDHSCDDGEGAGEEGCHRRDSDLSQRGHHGSWSRRSGGRAERRATVTSMAGDRRMKEWERERDAEQTGKEAVRRRRGGNGAAMASCKQAEYSLIQDEPSSSHLQHVAFEKLPWLFDSPLSSTQW